jgi:hypothetical protein
LNLLLARILPCQIVYSSQNVAGGVFKRAAANLHRFQPAQESVVWLTAESRQPKAIS